MANLLDQKTAEVLGKPEHDGKGLPGEGVEVLFSYLRSTKNTHVYVEQGTEVIGTLYVQKATVGSNPPQNLKVRLSVANS